MAQMLTESVVLSIFGGVIGTMLGAAIAITIATFTPIPAAVEVWSVGARHRHHRAGRPVLRSVSGDARGPPRSDRSAETGMTTMAIRARARLGSRRDGVRHRAHATRCAPALTVLGVVIGITSIVGMTAMIRGFDQSLRELIAHDRTQHDLHPAVRRHQLRQRRRVQELMKRPNLHDLRRARARGRRADAVEFVDVELGARRPGHAAPRVLPRPEDQADHRVRHDASTSPRAPRSRSSAGGSSTAPRSSTARTSSCSATPPYKLLFEPSGIDPIGKTVRVGSERFEVVGVFDKRPAAGGFNLGQDDFVVIPHTAYQRDLRADAVRVARQRDVIYRSRSRCVPREGVTGSDAHGRRRAGHAHPPRAEARRAERLRPRDAGCVPQAVGSDQPGDVLRAGRDLVDRADGRRHRRDGDHVDLGDRADARDRRAQGARRAPRARSCFSS